MNKKTLLNSVLAISLAALLFGTNVVSVNASATKANLEICASAGECISGNCNSLICCPSGTCGWGDGVNFVRECVASGQIRENSWASLICRSGIWKVRLNGWGCNNSAWGGCDEGWCQTFGDAGFCRSCAFDSGLAQGCANGEACPSGTLCNNTVCCPSGTCGYGDGLVFGRQCVASGEIRENLWGRQICRNGVWKTLVGGWGCDLFGECESGSCQKIGGYHYCISSLPFSSAYTSTAYNTGMYCQGTCRTCASEGNVCGNMSDNCGSTINCGTCTGGQSCYNNRCVFCLPGTVSGCKVCKSDGSAWQDDDAKCLTNQICSLGVCMARSSSDSLYIVSIAIANGGAAGYIDIGDTIKITFSKAIDPASINSGLSSGSYVSGVSSSQIGGVSVSSTGIVNINGIALFDTGTVDDSGTFTSKLALDSAGKVLTVTLTSGNAIRVVSENYSGTVQFGNTVKDTNGNAMASDAAIDDPIGGSAGTLSISSIAITNGGDKNYIDIGDTVRIAFSEAIDPASISGGLNEGDYVSGVSSSQTGGVSVSSTGIVTIKNIAVFDAGSVDDSGTFTSKLALSSTGKILTITLTGGGNIRIANESFGSASQIGGTVENVDGNAMEEKTSIGKPAGGFGEEGSIGASGDLSVLYAQIEALKAEITALQKQLAAMGTTGTGSYSCAGITKYLYYGITDPEVSCLQNFLKSQGYAVLATGTYDLATKAAVKQFQEKYAREILAPYGLTSGSGNVGNDTRGKINQLMAVK